MQPKAPVPTTPRQREGGRAPAVRCRALGQRPLLVGAVLAGVNDQLGAVLLRVPRIVHAQRVAVRLQPDLAVGQLAPLLIGGAVAGPQDDLAADAAVALIVQALAVVDELAVAERPVLRLVGAAARPDNRLGPVGRAVALVVQALPVVALDRVDGTTTTRGRRRRRAGRRAGGRGRVAQRGGELGGSAGVGARQGHGGLHVALAVSSVGGQRSHIVGQGCRTHLAARRLRDRAGAVRAAERRHFDRDALGGGAAAGGGAVVDDGHGYRRRRGNRRLHGAVI